jgi:hypothetical protein
LHRGEKAGINEITGKFVQLNSSETAQPDKSRVKLYREWQSIQNELSVSLRDVFDKHRASAALAV